MKLTATLSTNARFHCNITASARTPCQEVICPSQKRGSIKFTNYIIQTNN
jgi:hypothetical protein